MLTTLASYATIAGNLQRSLSTTAAKPQVARETEYYLAHIVDVKSIDDFLGDDRLFAYAMKAFGLEDMTYAKALMRKVLAGGIDKRDSFANSLADQRYREFAATFNFVRYEATTTIFDAPARALSTATSARRWRRMPASRTKACASPSISSARRRASPAPTASLPMRRC